ncbi:MAG: alpha-1,2-fucosyltransferase [Raineya sp.]
MILVRLNGGLGNQMFQYAFAKSLQLLHKKEVFLDISTFNDGYRKYELFHFNITLPVATAEQLYDFQRKQEGLFQSLKDRLLPYHLKSNVIERYYHFDRNLLKIKHKCTLNGYFQSEKYFKPFESTIRREFTFKHLPTSKNQELLQQIRQVSNATSVHIRRGDFVGNPVHPVQNETFLKKAVSILQSKIPNLHLFLFSNDIPWVKENLQFEVPFTIVDINNEESGFEDMRLMSACKHHIIANSSFSWWGAWLNPNPNKIVIAPAKWVDSQAKYYQNLEDIIPEGWIKIA